MRKSVAILTYDQLCLFEFALARDILRDRSGDFGDRWYDTSMFTLEEGPLQTEHGLVVPVTSDPDILETAHTIVVPGWRLPEPVPVGLSTAIRAAHSRGARVISICTGTFVLAAAGLLDGRRATTHWRDCDRLREQFPEIEVDPDVLYVDHGDVMTSAGSAAGIDMLLHMIWHDFGPEASNTVARTMVVSPHRDGGQAQFLPSPVLPATNAAFKHLVDRIRTDPSVQYSVEEMARHAAMSVRSFHRSFKAMSGYSPYEWLLRERVRRAKELLVETDEPLDWIALHSGFSAVEALRPVFRRVVGTTPSQYRRTFGARGGGRQGDR